MLHGQGLANKGALIKVLGRGQLTRKVTVRAHAFSKSAESAITQVQSALFAASTRLEQLQSTLDQLTTISTEKAVVGRDTGKSCPNSGPGDGPRRKMRDEDAGRCQPRLQRDDALQEPCDPGNVYIVPASPKHHVELTGC